VKRGYNDFGNPNPDSLVGGMTGRKIWSREVWGMF
jgi:hypothetical protein